MRLEPTVVVDARVADEFAALLAARRPGFGLDGAPVAQDPGLALARIASRYAGAIVQRLNQAPGKHQLAFLELLGQRLAAARAARAPVVFKLSDGAPGAVAAAGTSVAAPPPPGSSQQIVFETEKAAGVTPGKLVQVFSIWPGRDEYIDHSADSVAGKALSLFSQAAFQQAPHVLYLAHDALLKLTGNVELRVEFQLERPGADALAIDWEYWDGTLWRGFAVVTQECGGSGDQLSDATNGLTGSGVVRLRADGAVSEKTTVNGLGGYWIRGKLTEPLPPDPARTLPAVDSIRLSSIVSQPLQGRLAGTLLLRPSSDSNTLRARLLNEAGQPLPGAQVALRDADDINADERSDVSKEDGSFSLIIPAAATSHRLAIDVTFQGVQASALVAPTLLGAKDDRQPAATFTLAIVGTAIDKAFNDGTKLDTSKPFYPFGQFPQPGATFYFSSPAVFAKPGARARLYLPRTFAPTDRLKPQLNAETGTPPSGIVPLEPLLVWEYWNGTEWTALPVRDVDFAGSEIVDFRVPSELAPTSVNDEPGLWMRARLVSGTFGFSQTLPLPPNTTGQFTTLVITPPILAAARLGFAWQFGPFHAERVLAHNDFAYRDRTSEATWPGTSFQPYERMADSTPALYLGFDAKAPTSSIGVFLDLIERPADPARPRFIWEYWDGFEWFALSVDDGTADLTSPGILAFIAEDDSTPLARFGKPLHWVRGRLKEDGPPPEVEVQAIHPNAVWALQQRTFTDVLLGAASGNPSEIFRISQTPVIPGERVEVMELSGGRANVEWRLVALELCGGSDERVRALERLLARESAASEVSDGDVRLRRDKQKRVSEVWVRWQPRATLAFSGPGDRHYAFDAARGILFFGDGESGRALPQGAQVCARHFKSGGGASGNVAMGTITQLLGAISGVQAVFNPHAAEGGADGESLQSFQLRAPASVRHRGRALSTGDYEAMVREASAAVAVVKVLPSRNAAGRTLPGFITILIIPWSEAPQPYPSLGLRDEILRHLETRAPAGLIASGRIYVTGPEYHAVDVSATIVPLRDDEAGLVESRVREALERFLHPLRGGPSATGWQFGRSVHRSDVARVIESVEGVDHAELLQLLVSDEVRGETVEVSPQRIVAAGKIRLRLKGARS